MTRESLAPAGERQFQFVLTLPQDTIRTLDETKETFHFTSVQEALHYFVHLGTHAGIILGEAPILPYTSHGVTMEHGILKSKTDKSGLGSKFNSTIAAVIPESDMYNVHQLNDAIFHKRDANAAVIACLNQGMFVQTHIIHSRLNPGNFGGFQVNSVGKVTFTPRGK